MPLNLQDELLRKQQATDAYLGSVNPQDAADKSRTEIEAGRNRFFGNTVAPTLQGIGQNVGLTPTGIPARMQGTRLGTELDRSLRRNTFTSQRDVLDKTYSTALARATQAGLTNAAAQDYARQVASTARDQAFQLENKTADVQSGLRQQEVNQNYANQGIALNNLPQMDYQSALTRALFTGAAQAGTSYFLNRKPGTTTQTQGQVKYPQNNYNDIQVGMNDNVG